MALGYSQNKGLLKGCFPVVCSELMTNQSCGFLITSIPRWGLVHLVDYKTHFCLTELTCFFLLTNKYLVWDTMPTTFPLTDHTHSYSFSLFLIILNHNWYCDVKGVISWRYSSWIFLPSRTPFTLFPRHTHVLMLSQNYICSLLLH